jgi:sortase (surface protein transpeptidase)
MYALFTIGLSGIVVGASGQVVPAKAVSATNLSVNSRSLDAIIKKPQPQIEAQPVIRQEPAFQAAAIGLPASVPSKISIPAINVASSFIQVGKDSRNKVEVPTGNDFEKAAWYKYSVTPGEIGSSVVLGHVDSAFTGPSIFFNLGALKPNDVIIIDRADGSTVKFEVDSIKEYSKDVFPTDEVYGDTTESTLKLVTCSGAFDRASGDYQNNLVVFASRTDVQAKL